MCSRFEADWDAQAFGLISRPLRDGAIQRIAQPRNCQKRPPEHDAQLCSLAPAIRKALCQEPRAVGLSLEIIPRCRSRPGRRGRLGGPAIRAPGNGERRAAHSVLRAVDMRSHGMFRWPEGLRATFRRFHNYLHVNGNLGKKRPFMAYH